jgi:putative tryptophan/tyrosine transport system substrate-binding protein
VNRRRTVLLTIACAAICVPAQLFAQHKVKRIGLLWIKSESDASVNLKAFREGLRAQGYTEGKDVEIDARFLPDRYPLLPEAAARLVNEKVDVIVCFGGTAAIAASKATSTIPIVVMIGSDPVAAGLAESLSRPGKNITGIATIAQQIAPKRLELLKQAIPDLRIVGIVFNPESKSEAIQFKNLEHAARSLNLELRRLEVRHLGELPGALETASKLGVTALAPVSSTMFTANAAIVVAAVEKVRLPAIYSSDDFTRAGGLLAYGPRLTEGFRQAAVFVDKILKGAKPGELPIEQPTRLTLVINLKAAQTLRLTIPRELLLRADQVIE